MKNGQTRDTVNIWQKTQNDDKQNRKHNTTHKKIKWMNKMDPTEIQG